MPRKKLPSTKSKTSYPAGLKSSLKSYVFKGLSLGGGKTNKTAVANIEYFVSKNKIFLHSLKNKIKTEKDYSSDQQLFEYLNDSRSNLKYIAVNASLSMPTCITCKLKCPGFEKCTEPEILWLWDIHRELKKKRLFTPYTERCAEVYISNRLEEKFSLPHALGANMAPLTARAYYLMRRINKPFIEVYPKLSLWRIGRSIGIQKSYLRYHKHAVSGEEVREAIVNHLIKAEIAFIYDEDKKVLIEDNSSFEAFLCAITGVLKYKKQVEPRPKDFPKKEAWIDFPKEEINW